MKQCGIISNCTVVLFQITLCILACILEYAEYAQIYCSVTFDSKRDGIPQAQRHSNLFLLTSFAVVHVRLASRDLDNSQNWGMRNRGDFRGRIY